MEKIQNSMKLFFFFLILKSLGRKENSKTKNLWKQLIQLIFFRNSRESKNLKYSKLRIFGIKDIQNSKYSNSKYTKLKMFEIQNIQNLKGSKLRIFKIQNIQD